MNKRFLILAAMLVVLFTSTIAFAAPVDLPIKVGASGEDVQMVQKLLTDAGYYDGDIDGVFGDDTLSAVIAFQNSNGLTPDGVVGRETYLYLERASSQTSRYSRVLTMTASAYTAHDDGNSSYTYGGHLVRKGVVAVDPSVIPLGTRLYIEGYGYAVADDIGGAIRGNRIDLAFDSRSEALQFGVRRVTVHILD